ncbi:hypothetical protein HK101_007934 [Irineochytrium annulatum]|nr:hypothetical protein HK101_007934 [Irineochytrium annulatum]
MFVEYVTDSLKTKSDALLKRSATGQLQLQSKEVDLNSVIMKNLGSAITVNFDRLEKCYQDFLKTASVFGKQFNILDVVAVFDTETDPDKLLSWVTKYDSFGFIEPLFAAEESESRVVSTSEPFATASIGDENPDRDRMQLRYAFSFRNQSIADAVYEYLPYTERAEVHGRIGDHFQSQLTDGNRTSLLPIICFHFSKSNDLSKNISFAEELGLYYFESFYLPECIRTLERLIQFIDDNRSTIVTLPGTSGILSANRMAKIYGTLALALSFRLSFDLALKWAQRCLLSLGESWPETRRDMKFDLARTARQHAVLWWRTRCGTRRIDGKLTGEALAGAEALTLAYSAIKELSFWKSQSGKYQYALSLIKLTNIQLATLQDPLKLTGHVMRLAFSFSFVAPGVGRYYWKHAMRMHKELARANAEQTLTYNHVLFWDQMSKGHLTAAEELVNAYINNRQRHTDFYYAYAADFMRHMCHFMGGKFKTGVPLIEEAYDQIVEFGMYEHAIWGSYTICKRAALLGNVSLSRVWLKRVADASNALPPCMLRVSYHTVAALIAAMTNDGALALAEIKTALVYFQDTDRVVIGCIECGVLTMLVLWVLLRPGQSVGAGAGAIGGGGDFEVEDMRGRKMKSPTLMGRSETRKVSPAISSTARAPTVQELKSLVGMLKNFRNLHRKLGGKCGIWMAWWTAQLADAAIMFITDLKVPAPAVTGSQNGLYGGSELSAQAPSSARSVKGLMAAMERDPHAVGLKEFVMMKAILYGVVGKVLRDESSLTVSRQKFAQFGSAFFLQWVL